MELKSKTLKTTSIVARVLEWGCFGALLAYVVALVVAIAFPDAAAKFFGLMANENRGELSVQGFDITVLKDGEIIRSALVGFSIAGIFAFACRVMIFRNIHLVLKTAAGKTWFSKGETPFQKDITRMVREIGIFYILIPVLELILSVIFRPIIGMETAEINVHFEGIITGFVIIALSQIFNYGEKLEGEVEGLV